MVRFLRSLANCSDKMTGGCSEYEKIVSLNYRKFGVKCDWNSDTSQIRTKVIFLKKWGFLKKDLIFFKIGKSGKFAVECVSNAIISWKSLFHLNCEVFAKNQKSFTFGKITKFDEKYFLEKNAFILLNGIFNKIGGRKYAGGSWSSCYYYWFKVKFRSAKRNPI